MCELVDDGIWHPHDTTEWCPHDVVMFATSLPAMRIGGTS